MVPIGHPNSPDTFRVVEQEIGPEAVQQLDGPTWHLVDAIDSLTLCGLAIHYGARRKLWAETPNDDRCARCKRRVGAAETG
jgi:hypothetical protein